MDYTPLPPQLTTIANLTLQNFSLGLNDLWLQLSRRIKDDVAAYQQVSRWAAGLHFCGACPRAMRFNSRVVRFEIIERANYRLLLLPAITRPLLRPLSLVARLQRYSLIHQPYPLIVPGGRFVESYYWDSYWVIQGLLRCGMTATAQGVALNLVHMLDTFGFVPNGGRVYYAMPGRSQVSYTPLPPLSTVCSSCKAATLHFRVALAIISAIPLPSPMHRPRLLEPLLFTCSRRCWG